MFGHLKRVNQTYIEHWFDAINYSFISLKASFYFFIHSFCPDLYEFDGSKTIKELNTNLEEKKRRLNIKD